MAFDWVSFGMNAVWWFIIGFIGILVCVIVFLFTRFIVLRSKYKQYVALIFKRKKDKNDKEYLVFVGIDKGAIFKDKKLKKWSLHLKDTNIDLGEDEGADGKRDENRELDIPSIPSERGGEVIFIEKLGPRKFAIGNPIDWDGQVKVSVSEADIAEALRVYDVNARYFGKDNSQLWAFIIYMVFGVLVLIMVIYTLQKFDVLADVAQKLSDAATKLGPQPVVMPSGAPG